MSEDAMSKFKIYAVIVLATVLAGAAYAAPRGGGGRGGGAPHGGGGMSAAVAISAVVAMSAAVAISAVVAMSAAGPISAVFAAAGRISAARVTSVGERTFRRRSSRRRQVCDITVCGTVSALDCCSGRFKPGRQPRRCVERNPKRRLERKSGRECEIKRGAQCLELPLGRRRIAQQDRAAQSSCPRAIAASAATAGWHNGRGGDGRNGWWRHGNGGYGWVGPLFWPFAYYDMYDYAMWGYGDAAFWDYGYNDIYAGVFAPYGYDDLAGYLPQGAGGNQPGRRTHCGKRSVGANVRRGQPRHRRPADRSNPAGYPA